jgi:hypothetical protein
MKRRSTVAIMAAVAVCVSAGTLKAGDPARAGQAGASELLIDPWAGTSGWAGSNTACVQGVEAQFLNVAGTAFTTRTEVILGSTDWLDGSGIHISAAGLCQHVGAAGTLGLSIMSMNLGNIPITTYDNPDGGVGYYTPQMINLGLSYAKSFSDNIYGGINAKVISEAISNVHAFGFAIDAGIQYLAGDMKQIHFGIALKNVGPRMSYSGDGMAFETNLPNGNSGQMTVEQRSQGYELPSLVNIGAAYDFHLASHDSSGRSMHRITVAANFTSNSFTQDEEMLGVEYGFKSFFMARIGYDYQNGVTSPLSTNPQNGGRLTALTGPCAGITLQVPFGKTHSIFGVSYGYRATNPYNGCHTIGIKLALN